MGSTIPTNSAPAAQSNGSAPAKISTFAAKSPAQLHALFFNNGDLSVARANEFNRLAPAAQQKILNGAIDAALAAGDDAGAEKLLEVIAGLVENWSGPFASVVDDAMRAKLNVLSTRSESTTMVAQTTNPQLLAAMDALGTGTITAEQVVALAKPEHMKYLTAEQKGQLAKAAMANTSWEQALVVFESARDAVEWNTICGAFAGDGVDANAGHAAIQQLITSSNASQTGSMMRRFNAATVRANSASSQSLAESARHGALDARLASALTTKDLEESNGELSPAGGATSGVAGQGALKGLSDAQAQQQYDQKFAAVNADGKLEVGELWELFRASVDPEGYTTKLLLGDQELMKMLSENPAMFEMVKGRMAKINALQDALTGISDDIISRRKKLAESLARG